MTVSITVTGREPTGWTERPTLVYRCECGQSGIQGVMTRHLHQAHSLSYTEITRRLSKARWEYNKAEAQAAQP